jgi:preprotein translocase subunit SecE
VAQNEFAKERLAKAKQSKKQFWRKVILELEKVEE